MLDSFIITERTLATNKDGVVSFLFKELGRGHHPKPSRFVPFVKFFFSVYLSFFLPIYFSLALRRQPACVKQQSKSLCGVVQFMCACVLVSCQRKTEEFCKSNGLQKERKKEKNTHTQSSQLWWFPPHFKVVCNHLESTGSLFLLFSLTIRPPSSTIIKFQELKRELKNNKYERISLLVSFLLINGNSSLPSRLKLFWFIFSLYHSISRLFGASVTIFDAFLYNYTPRIFRMKMIILARCG